MADAPCSSCPLSCDEAVAIVRHELAERGLGATHRVASLHGAPDHTAEGAAFAAILLPRPRGTCPGRAVCLGYKLLIAADGGVTCRSWRARARRSA
jgi:hypothetical protein